MPNFLITGNKFNFMCKLKQPELFTTEYTVILKCYYDMQ